MYMKLATANLGYVQCFIVFNHSLCLSLCRGLVREINAPTNWSIESAPSRSLGPGSHFQS